MQSTDEKTKNSKNIKKYILRAFLILIAVLILVVSFGGAMGVPSWENIFEFCGIYADLGDGISLSFIDVGSADACYVKCGDKNVLIDAGTSLSYNKISAYLERNECEHFDAIIISHPDSDHMGAAADIIRDFGTESLYVYPVDEDIISTGAEYDRFVSSLEEYKVNVINPQIPSEIKIGEMKLKFISPIKDYGNTNDCSLAVMIYYGSRSFLFTGDMSKKVENDLLNSKVKLNADVLKVAHHGSSTSSCNEFLSAVSPEISVVSVGSNESYLPDYYTMARINGSSRKLYRTDTDKTVVITSDGSTLSVKSHA